MRRICKLPPCPGCSSDARQPLLSAYSTFSPAGGGGGGRGRGRGASPPPPFTAPRAPGRPSAEEDDAFTTGIGRGRSGAAAAQPGSSSSSSLPNLSSIISSLIPPSSAGRGRGRGAPPQPPSETAGDSAVVFKQPSFSRRDGLPPVRPPPSEMRPPSDPEVPASSPPRSIADIISTAGIGRGKAPMPAADQDSMPGESDRHRRSRQAPGAAKLSREDAVKKALEALSGGKGGDRPRGRGGFARRRRESSTRTPGRRDSEEYQLYLGDNADGEKLEKKLGEDKMKILLEGFEEMSGRVLPSPVEDAYLDALHTNNLIEYEPEYLVNFENPDIDEKPPMPLDEFLEIIKPFLMAYEGIQSQEEWEEIMKELNQRLPVLKELMDMYSGPDRITAKQQIEELERLAKTLPESVPASVKRFADRAVISLQSNPGWGFDKKCKFMNMLVRHSTRTYT